LDLEPRTCRISRVGRSRTIHTSDQGPGFEGPDSAVYSLEHGAGVGIRPAGDQARRNQLGHLLLNKRVKPTTTLRIQTHGNAVTVAGSNAAYSEMLNLSGTIEPNGFGGAGVLRTASRPATRGC